MFSIDEWCATFRKYTLRLINMASSNDHAGHCWDSVNPASQDGRGDQKNYLIVISFSMFMFMFMSMAAFDTMDPEEI